MKLTLIIYTQCMPLSPPARGRGLKHKKAPNFDDRSRVAPRAGAWIETVSVAVAVASSPRSPPARGRGLKPVKETITP